MVLISGAHPSDSYEEYLEYFKYELCLSFILANGMLVLEVQMLRHIFHICVFLYR